MTRTATVVLVLHSYGGWPGSRAIKTLDKETRNANGKATAFLLPDNASMANYSYLPPWLTVKVRSLVQYCSNALLIMLRMAAAFRTVQRCRCYSVTWKPQRKTTVSLKPVYLFYEGSLSWDLRNDSYSPNTLLDSYSAFDS